MKEFKIKFESLEGAASFVEVMEKMDVRGDILFGRTCLDVKSLMGIAAMDFTKPLILLLHEDEQRIDEIQDEIGAYII